jgi:hypothetical protein
MAKFPSEEQDRFIVRMPDGMRDRLKDAAAKNSRSMNAEIVARLAYTFDQSVHHQPMTPEMFDELFDKQVERRANPTDDATVEMLGEKQANRIADKVTQRFEAALDDFISALVGAGPRGAEIHDVDKLIERADHLLKKPDPKKK